MVAEKFLNPPEIYPGEHTPDYGRAASISNPAVHREGLFV